ncbi:MAG TPA: RNA polymerase sigma factor [candidate division Zixibacteria bacterium]|nr:RNA polymerase sigma factor [candidate division Zixibacteria bacterium]
MSASEALVSTSQAKLDYWVEQCLAGEESAYVEVYNQYAGVIYRLCFSLLRHKEDAEEVLQDTFEYAFRKLHNFDPTRASLKTWLYQIAVSRCRNKRRRKWLQTTAISTFAREQVVDEGAISPDDAITLTERQLLVWNALGDLSPKLRETAILRYYDGLTYAQIGEVLKIPSKTAESRMRLAHKALKIQLTEDISSSSDS